MQLELERTRIFDKVLGCLAVGAIGDTLGRPLEGGHYEDIASKYGVFDDPWVDIAGGDRNFELGTDDTALAQILCHCYIDKARPIAVEDYAEYWLKEMDPLKYFHCLRNTYELLKMGYSPRVTGAFNIVTGSGLMAIQPVGIFNAGDPQRAYIDAINLASLVQRDLDMFIPGIIAAAIAEAFRPNATCDSIIDTVISIAPSKPMITFNNRNPDNLRDTLIRAVEIADRHKDVFSVRGELYEKCLQYKAIDPQEVLALTFGIFKASGGDTRLAVLGGANIGRDADTIASLNGQITGALNGFNSAPPEWLDGLRQTPQWRDLEDTARKMTHLLIKRIEKAHERVEEMGQLR